MPTQIRPERAGNTTLVQQDQTNILPGDVDVETLIVIRYPQKGLTVDTIIKPNNLNTKDIMPRVQIVDLYYSIFTPTIYCELQIYDAVDDLHNQILGEEYIYLQYKSPVYEAADSIRLLFKIYKISDVTTLPNNRARTYTIYAASPEAIDNATINVSRSLRTREGEAGTNISDIVPTILSSDLKTTKKIDIEPTTGIVDKFLNKLYPLEAIDYLRQIATTSSKKTGSYVFFERPDGYVFRTLEDLFSKGQKKGPVASYIYDTIGNSDFEIDRYSRIIVYNEVSFVDNYTKIVSGGFANEVNNLDLITGIYTTVAYDHTKSRGSATYADPTDRAMHNTDQFMDAYKNKTYSKYIVSAATDGINNLAQKLASQQAYALELAQNIVQMSAHGNSKVMIGDVLDISILKPTAMTVDGDKNVEPYQAKMISGKYLIARSRETIRISNRPTHLQSFELIKGQFLIERTV